MHFDQKTISILKNFSTINQSIVFKPGNVVSTISPSKTILAKATIDHNIDKPFAIWDLSRFLGTVSLFNDPELTVKEGYMEIRQDKKKLNYTFTEPSLIVSPPDKDIKFPEAEVEFNISGSDLQAVNKALSVLSLTELAIEGDGEFITVQAKDTKNPSGDVYSINVGETTDKFSMVIKAENLKIVPGDYEVKITSKGLSHWKTDGIEYYISVEGSSKFGE